MYVILDSTVFIPDYFLNKPHHVLFRNFANKSLGDKIRVPKVVFEEVLNKYKEECLKIDAQTRSVNPEYKDNAGKRYRKYSRKLVEILKELNAGYLKYPPVSHEEIVKRDLNRRKPFSESGKGYRDTLIWESILQLIKREKQEIVFLTDNYKDYCCSDKDNTLHPHLYEDIRNLGIKDVKIRIIRNIPAFNEEIVIPTLQKLEQLEKQLFEETHPFINLIELVDAHEKELREIIDANINLANIDTKYEYSTNIVSTPVIEWVVVHETGNNEVFIKFKATFKVEFNFAILYQFEKIEIPPSDQSWMGQDGGPLTIEMECSLIFNQNIKSISSFNFELIRPKKEETTP
jgi:predicted nucleic acid-binding protein